MPRKPQPPQIPAAFRAIKPREYGSTKQVVAEAFNQAGGAKRAGAFFDLSPSVIYGFTDPDAKGCDLSLDRARRLTFVEGVKAFAVDMAACAGGIFIEPTTLEDAQSLVNIGGDISHDVADVTTELLRAVRDGNVTEAERGKLRQSADRAIAALVALRNRVTEGGAP